MSKYLDFFALQPGQFTFKTKADSSQAYSPGAGTIYAFSLNVDANHDGNMDLTYGGFDTTSPTTPMQFWINNDNNGTGVGQDEQPFSFLGQRIIWCVLSIVAALFFQPITSQSAQTPTAPPTAISNSTAVTSPPLSERNKMYDENIKADPQYDWKQPIDFYGRVVDESNQPVAGASVDYTWSTIAKNGTLTKHDEADAFGMFSIHEKGKRIGITISKDGYYTPRNEKLRSYEYANPYDGLFTPDIDNPVVFHLRKKGPAEPLIKSEQRVKIALGSKVTYDLRTCRTNVGDASVEFELIKNKGGNTNRTEWVFRITALNGGVQFATNEFSFLAPTNDYQASIEMTLDSPKPEDWRNNGYAGGVAFVKTAAGFGKVEIRMVSLSSRFQLASYFNPSGSRNLEFDPDKAIQPRQ